MVTGMACTPNRAVSVRGPFCLERFVAVCAELRPVLFRSRRPRPTRTGIRAESLVGYARRKRFAAEFAGSRMHLAPIGRIPSRMLVALWGSLLGVPVGAIHLMRRKEQVAESLIFDSIDDVDARIVVSDARRVVTCMAHLHAVGQRLSTSQLPRKTGSDLTAIADATVAANGAPSLSLPAVTALVDAGPEPISGHSFGFAGTRPRAIHIADDLGRVAGDRSATFGARNGDLERSRLGEHANLLSWGAIPPDDANRRGGFVLPIIPTIARSRARVRLVG
jgi:hypothetical protein